MKTAKKKPPPDDPKQSARFVETATAVEADANASKFAKALKLIVPERPKSRKQ